MISPRLPLWLPPAVHLAARHLQHIRVRVTALRRSDANRGAINVGGIHSSCRAAGAKKILGMYALSASISQCQMAFGSSRRLQRVVRIFHKMLRTLSGDSRTLRIRDPPPHRGGSGEVAGGGGLAAGQFEFPTHVFDL